ncbi:methyltransferase domain-containing protein [Candidatus Peregrinibacteria bacterium]|nr:methyltransferase domain-containing protein [Candidatus Peregrinibacteria bacterium]
MSDVYGFDRGTPLDRYYIENFLSENAKLLKGVVLEVLNDNYTKKYGGDNVSRSDVLDIDPKNKQANIRADLRNTQNLPPNVYDCIILTQVLQFIDDVDAAIASAYRMLKPGGTLLCTLPSVSRIDCVAKEEGDYWRFTKASATYLFAKHFKGENLVISAFGNVFVDVCFLEGIALEEITKKELDYVDSNFPLLICVKAIKEQ